MPRHAADLEEALKKKGGLTLSQLANYDDVLTDALVDRVYFWAVIRKLKANFHASRGVQEEDVCKILQQEAIVNKDIIAAHKGILSLTGIQRFYRALKTDDEKEHFERHLRKYVSIYHPDCPFEVGTSNRYTIMTAEAAIIARKHIRKGEPIKYLSGIQVEMTEKEEKELSNRTDFSIVVSSRRKRPSLFLGPARFANHDCDSNAKLNTSGPHGIHIIACKNIAPGDEITVTYGEDYFGVDNCECLCGTCESLRRNGWDPRGPIVHDDDSDDEEDEDESIPGTRKRKRDESGDIFSRRPVKRRVADPNAINRIYGVKGKQRMGQQDQALEELRMHRSRRHRYVSREANPNDWWSPKEPEELSDPMLEKILSLLGSVGDRVIQEERRSEVATSKTPEITVSIEEHTADGASDREDWFPETPARSDNSSLEPSSAAARIKAERSFSSLRHVTNVDEDSDVDVSTRPHSPSPMSKTRQQPADEVFGSSTGSTSPSHEAHSASSSSSMASSATSIDFFSAGSIAKNICEMLTSEIVRDTDPEGTEADTMDEQAEEQVEEQSTDLAEVEEVEAPPAMSRKSTRNKATSGAATPITSIEQKDAGEEGEQEGDEHEERRGEPRIPGDYTLCKALLPTYYHRWVECRNCDEHFVQGDAYLTRIACPRCERHSKLYGYHWPKTDKEGKNDREERVLDHRTIHRFIDPEEERMERKGRRTLQELMVERARGSSRLESEEESEKGPRGRLLRASPRGRSESGRRRPGLRMTM